MKNLVSTAKMLLIERATEFYTDRRSEIHPSEYENHYSNLGRLIASIDSYVSLSTIIRDIENEEFGQIGLSGADEDIAYFMKDLYDSI